MIFSQMSFPRELLVRFTDFAGFSLRILYNEIEFVGVTLCGVPVDVFQQGMHVPLTIVYVYTHPVGVMQWK